MDEDIEVRQMLFAEECINNPPYLMHSEHTYQFPRVYGTEMTLEVAPRDWEAANVHYEGESLNLTPLVNPMEEGEAENWWTNWAYFLDLPDGTETHIKMALMSMRLMFNIMGTKVTTQLLVPHVKVIHIIINQLIYIIIQPFLIANYRTLGRNNSYG